MALKRQGLSRDESNRIQGLLKYLEEQSEALDFLQPLDYKSLGLNDYPLIIKKPMDLSTVKKNLKNSRYASAEELFEDLTLIWDNCRTYNMSDSPVYHHADSMERHMTRYCNMHAISIEVPNKRNRPDIVHTDYQVRIDFKDNLKKLHHRKIGQIVEVLQKNCPDVINTLSEGRLQVKVNLIDADTFQVVNQ